MYLCRIIEAKIMWQRFIQSGKKQLDRVSHWLERQAFDESLIGAVQKWLPYVVGAIVVAVVAVIYEKIFEWVGHLLHLIKDEVPWMFLVLSPGMLWLSWWLVQRYAPAAGGSGIPQLMAALDSRRDATRASTGFLLGGKVFLTKLASSVAALFGGAVIGREGPTIQMSASIFYIVHKILPHSWPRLNRHWMLVAGGAAGLAAAFNTPLGGIVFAIEELTRTHLNQFKTTLLYAVIVAGITAQLLLGPYLYLGYPKITSQAFGDLWWVVVISAIAGLAGAWKSKLILQIFAWKKKRIKGRRKHYFVIVAGLLLAGLIIINESDAYGPGKEIMNTYLFDQPGEEASFLLLGSRFFGAIISYTTGIAGGVFATSLTTGSIVGELLTNLLGLAPENKIFILVAMIGFLTGVTRSPFTSSILVLEMTDRHSAIFSFMIAGLVASFAARLIDKRSLYAVLAANYFRQEERLLAEKEDPEEPSPPTPSPSG